MNKVIIGMSGGVDSSVAAYLLKEAGYEVEALFMRNWDSDVNGEFNNQVTTNICSQEQDYNDALAVCQQLDIKLHRVDFVKEYWDYVFTYFLDELKNGRTPNPDVMCNKFIKFDLFKKEAERLGAKIIATGHYAIIKNNKLYKALDKDKDQSYFLSMLSTEQLTNVLMPLGEMTKKEVREIAGKLNLITKDKKDSTGICFIGERNFNQFLENYLPHQDGQIKLLETGEIIGRHSGLMYYTIGQRKGIHTSLNEPLFVYNKDLSNNELIVTKNEANLISRNCKITDLILRNQDLNNISCKFRYRQEDIRVTVELVGESEALLTYNQAKAVAVGQIAVLYNEQEECIGAGIIDQVIN